MSDGKDVTRRSRWPYISLIPIGLGAWAPIYAGVRARQALWVALGVVWSAVVVAGFIVSDKQNTEGALLIIGWVGAIATSFSIRSAYDRRMGSSLAAAQTAGEQRLHERTEALRIARENPALAQEMGIGRPDVAGAAHGGLVDVNNAAVTALLGLPRIDGDLATRVIEVRGEVNGFSSLEDMGTAVDLPGDVVEALRGRVVFLPRA
jgi:DNA uptake protein ComE-like DNA-binding protein